MTDEFSSTSIPDCIAEIQANIDVMPVKQRTRLDNACKCSDHRFNIALQALRIEDRHIDEFNFLSNLLGSSARYFNRQPFADRMFGLWVLKPQMDKLRD